MISTGNDIISLNDIDIVRTKQLKFYSKILSGAEIALYNDQQTDKLPLEIYTWLLWSVKESAYKYLQRLTPRVLFSPTKFIVEHLQQPSINSFMNENIELMESCGFDGNTVYKSIITVGENKLHSNSLINKHYIFSVVNYIQNFNHTCWGVKFIDDPGHEHQSAAVREFVIERLSIQLQCDDITISKSLDGYPTILKDNKVIPLPLSLSHQGHWVAYSFQAVDIF